MLGKLFSPLANLRLARKFTILLGTLFLVGITLSGFVLANVLNYNAQNQISSQAGVLLRTMESLRDYTQTQVNPELQDRLSAEFLPQSVPAYSVREVFEGLRANPAWREFFYKDATLNPTNLRDRADDFETQIVQRFRQNSDVRELSGFRPDSASGKLFYIAQPITIKKESCLQCHSTPEKAPPTMIERYGSEHGFGWELNEIVGTKMIYVPADRVLQRARQWFVAVMGVVVAIFAIAISIVNFGLQKYVIQPLNRMAQVADAVSTGDMEAEFEQSGNDDEVGRLAEAFVRMKTSLVLAMKRLRKYRSS